MYVNDIVLAEIIYGRVHYVFRAQVHVVALRFCAFLAEHEDIVATAVDGQVARCANGFNNGQAVLSDGLLARILDFAKDGDVLVVAVDGHYGVAQFSIAQNGLDLCGSFGARQARNFCASKGGDINTAVFVDGI